MPDGTSRLSYKGRLIHHYMGTSTFAEHTVLPEIALAKIRDEGAARQGVPVRLRRQHGDRRGALHGEGRAGRDRGGVRARRRRLSVIQGAVLAGAEQIIAIDTNPAKFAMAQAVRRHPHAEPGGHDNLVEAVLVAHGRRRRLLVRVHRQRRGDGPGAPGGAPRLGPVDHHRRRGRGPGDPRAAVPARDGPLWRGSAFGGVKGRTQVPGMVDQYMNGGSSSTRCHPHDGARGDQQGVRSHARRQEHSVRHSLLTGAECATSVATFGSRAPRSALARSARRSRLPARTLPYRVECARR